MTDPYIILEIPAEAPIETFNQAVELFKNNDDLRTITLEGGFVCTRSFLSNDIQQGDDDGS